MALDTINHTALNDVPQVTQATNTREWRDSYQAVSWIGVHLSILSVPGMILW